MGVGVGGVGGRDVRRVESGGYAGRGAAELLEEIGVVGGVEVEVGGGGVFGLESGVSKG